MSIEAGSATVSHKAVAGTDSTTMTFPSTSASIARTDAAQAFTGSQTFNGPVIGAAQALSGPGAVNITQPVTKFTSTLAGNALTLADGVEGQIKTIVYVAGGTDIYALLASGIYNIEVIDPLLPDLLWGDSTSLQMNIEAYKKKFNL
jgi:hypothetical protein